MHIKPAAVTVWLAAAATTPPGKSSCSQLGRLHTLGERGHAKGREIRTRRDPCVGAPEPARSLRTLPAPVTPPVHYRKQSQLRTRSGTITGPAEVSLTPRRKTPSSGRGGGSRLRKSGDHEQDDAST
jgi:hypothetical protein